MRLFGLRVFTTIVLALGVNACLNVDLSFNDLDGPTITGSPASGEPIALFRGNTTTGTDTLNPSDSTTPTTIAWNEAYLNEDAFTPSGTDQVVVESDGDYLLTVTSNITSLSGTLISGLTLQAYVNGVAHTGALGHSFIRNVSGHGDTSINFATLLEDLSVGDVVDLRVHRNSDSIMTARIADHISVYLERMDGGDYFFAHSTQSVSGTDLNGTAAELEWSSVIEAPSYFSHNNATLPEDITLQNAGDYIVSVNIPLHSPAARANIFAQIRLNGVPIQSGGAAQGYIRSTNGHNLSSLHVVAPLVGVAAGDILNVSVQREANAGVVTVEPGEVATLFVIPLPSEGVFIARFEPNASDWNLSASGADADLTSVDRMDSAYATVGDEIEILEEGEYLYFFNGVADRPTGTGRTNHQILLRLNGGHFSGSGVQSHYIRGSNDHQRSSGTIAFPMPSMSANDRIKLTSFQETTSTMAVDAFDPAVAVILKR